MTTKLNELEAKLQKLYDDRSFVNTRAVFDIGVEFGRLLQQQNIQDYEYEFWKKLDEKSNNEKLINEAIQAINNFLLKLVHNSIKDYIKKNGRWKIAKYSLQSEQDEFDAGTCRKYCVQIKRVDMREYGGNFECVFEVVGRLAKIFKKYKISTQLDVDIYNSNGEEYAYLDETESIASTVSDLYSRVRNFNNWEVAQYQDFLQEISKDFLLELIKDA